jgi:uncharacterized protein YigE (DUF2233 family)
MEDHVSGAGQANSEYRYSNKPYQFTKITHYPQVAKKRFFIIILLYILISGLFSLSGPKAVNEAYVSYQVDPKNNHLKLYWRDDRKQLFKSIGNLKSWLDSKGQRLVLQ